MTESWTIARVLEWTRNDFAARGLASPRLEAEVLLAHALAMERVALYTRFDQPLGERELATIRALVERRRAHEPIAYIVGAREFFGRRFEVDRRVLVPRPETEGVVEAALALLPPPCDGTRPRALDIGTGSGILAVTLAAERPDLDVVASDVSPDALAVATRNAEALGVASRIRFVQGALFDAVGTEAFALVVSNPPYIPSGEIESLMRDVREFEPRLALDGGPNGDRVLAPLVAEAPRHLTMEGALVVELHHDQARHAEDLATRAGLSRVEVRRDLAGIERVLVAQR